MGKPPFFFQLPWSMLVMAIEFTTTLTWFKGRVGVGVNLGMLLGTWNCVFGNMVANPLEKMNQIFYSMF